MQPVRVTRREALGMVNRAALVGAFLESRHSVTIAKKEARRILRNYHRRHLLVYVSQAGSLTLSLVPC